MKMIPQPQLKDWEPYVFFEKEFTPSECRTIIQIGKTLQPHEALTGGGNDKKIRSSEVSWLFPKPEVDWIFERLASVCRKVQQSWYPFSLAGFAEPIQLTHYLASDGGHYETHRDFGNGPMSTRKLSLVMLLNDPSEFVGGELELLALPGEDKAVKQIAQGAVIAFPSWELHRVRRVTQGERYSLVCWVHGAPFV